MIPLQARYGPEGGLRYSSTLPWPRHWKGVSGQQHAPTALYPRERPSTHFTGGWVGPRAGLEERNTSSPSGFDPGPSSPQSVAIPTELPSPLLLNINISNHNTLYFGTANWRSEVAAIFRGIFENFRGISTFSLFQDFPWNTQRYSAEPWLG